MNTLYLAEERDDWEDAVFHLTPNRTLSMLTHICT